MASKTKPTCSATSDAKTRGKIWSDEATMTLISLWGEDVIQNSLNDSKSSKQTSEVYKSLLVQMKEKGFEQFNLKELINKIKKLRQKYKTLKDKKKRSGTGTQRPWKYFESLDVILGTRANVSPPVIIDTMQVIESQDPVDEMTEKYGSGRSYIQKCDTCTYEKEIWTEGVHVSESGSVRVYSEPDEFHCPKCDKEDKNYDEDRNEHDENQSETSPDDKAGTVTMQEEPEEIKPKIITKKKRKSNIEKTLDLAFERFNESSNADFSRFQQMEEERMKRDQEFQAQQRREEREHEFRMMSLLLGVQTPTNHQNYPTTSHNDQVYFEL